jgi:hypothetical protein
MPYTITSSGKCWSVVNTETGAIKSKCTTYENAKRQIRLLYALHSKSRPRKSRSKRRKSRSKRRDI